MSKSRFVTHFAEHKALAEKLLDVVQNDAQHDFVAVEQDHRAWLLDGPQGSGKSYFVEQYLKPAATARAIPVIQLNAFEHDFEDEPLLSMTGAIARGVDGKDGDTAAALGRRALEFAMSNVPAMSKAVGSVAGSPLGFSAIGATVGEAAGKAFAPWWKKSPLSEFQGELQRAVAVLTTPGDDQQDGDGDDGPVGRCILLVDDLDRCRPTFALRLLERVLHVFPVNGLAVLVVSDRKALEGTAQREYGFAEGRHYMDKFFRASFAFEPLDAHGAFLAWFAEEAKADMVWGHWHRTLARLFGDVARSKSLTLRQVSDAADHARRWGDWGVLHAYGWVVLASVWLMRTFPEGQTCIESIRRGESSCEEVLECLGAGDDEVRKAWQGAFENRDQLVQTVTTALGIRR